MRALAFSLVVAIAAPSDGCPLSKIFSSGDDASATPPAATDGGPVASRSLADAAPPTGDAATASTTTAGGLAPPASSASGACVPPCTLGRICMNGACACPHPGDVFCAKGCTNPKSDNFACGCAAGGAGAVCKAGEECCGGRCVACAAGEPLDRATCACKKAAAPAGKIVCGDCMGKCTRKTLCTACCTGTPDDCARLTRLCGP